MNVVVDNAHTTGAPVLTENTPTYQNLFGSIENGYFQEKLGDKPQESNPTPISSLAQAIQTAIFTVDLCEV